MSPPLEQNNNYSLMSTKRKCSPLPSIDIKTVFRVWKLFSVTQKASLRFFYFAVEFNSFINIGYQ